MVVKAEEVQIAYMAAIERDIRRSKDSRRVYKGRNLTILQPDSAMSRFLLVVASLLGKNCAITPRRLSKC